MRRTIRRRTGVGQPPTPSSHTPGWRGSVGSPSADLGPAPFAQEPPAVKVYRCRALSSTGSAHGDHRTASGLSKPGLAASWGRRTSQHPAVSRTAFRGERAKVIIGIGGIRQGQHGRSTAGSLRATSSRRPLRAPSHLTHRIRPRSPSCHHHPVAASGPDWRASHSRTERMASHMPIGTARGPVQLRSVAFVGLCACQLLLEVFALRLGPLPEVLRYDSA